MKRAQLKAVRSSCKILWIKKVGWVDKLDSLLLDPANSVKDNWKLFGIFDQFMHLIITFEREGGEEGQRQQRWQTCCQD